MSCEMKTLKLYRGYPSRFNFQNWLNVSFNTEILIDGWGARFELGNIVKTYENVQDGFSINLSAEETQGLSTGLLNGSIILVDLEGNDHPFLTALPVLVSDWVEGDVEEDGFNYEIKVDIQQNELIINIKGGTSGDVDDRIIWYINQHDNNEQAHPFIQGLIETESQAREQSDNELAQAISTETTAREQADEALAQSIQNETDARTQADTSLGTRIDNEATTRGNADTALGNRIDTEEQARIDEDEALDQRIDEVVGDLDDHIQDKNNPHEVTKAQVGLGNVDNTSDMNKPVSTAQENAIQAVQDNLDDETDARLLSEQGLQDQIDGKQPTISDLDTIRSNASAGKSASDTIATYGNIVTHNTSEFATAEQGAKADTALQPSDLSATSPIAYNSSTKTISVESGYQIPTTTQVGKIGTNETAIATINSKIPSEATSGNQLADKAFVNSTVGTNTANYISNNGQPFTSLAQLQAYTGTVTNNDYAFITGTDEEGNTFYDRYKATVNGTTISWAKEYRLNNSSFTASQWASIQSGITSGDVALIGTALQPQDNISELTNDAGYITGISSSDVTGALGYTPYNSTNPNNYISRSGISATSPIAYNNSTGVVSVASGYQIPTTTQITTFTNKQDTITGGATTITTSNLTANRALVSNASGKVAVSEVTSTELGYLDGVTSAIQTQLNNKANDNAVVKLTGNQTVGGNKTFLNSIAVGDTTSHLGNIELYGGNQNYGGFFDFHYKDSTADYTSRIIEDGNGYLKINGAGFPLNASGAKLYAAPNEDTTSSLQIDTVGARNTKLQNYQPTLVSGTNIKTINGSTILGSGNLQVDGLPSQSGQSGKFLTTNGTSASWSEVEALPSQTGHSGSVLTTNGTSASWAGMTECAVVIESKRPTTADPTWYRKYSDGWVEQGGQVSGAYTDNYRRLITLPIEMSDNLYSVSLTGTANDQSNYNLDTFVLCTFMDGGKSKTQMIVAQSENNASKICIWEVKGYAAE